MSHSVACFRCGNSLAELSLPLSRQDQCRQCGSYLHVCRMCRSYDPAAVDQCLEDDAERVRDKDVLNYCEYFVATEGAFDPAAKTEADTARERLDALFGDGEPGAREPDDAPAAAEALFGKGDGS
jgi:hypothetical protein